MATFWAGQGAPLCKAGSVKTIMADMLKKYEETLLALKLQSKS